MSFEKPKYTETFREKGYAALRAAIASFALLMGAPAPASAAQIPAQYEETDFSKSAERLRQQRYERQQQGVWNMESEALAKFLFRQCKDHKECEVVSRAFSAQDIMLIEQYVTRFLCKGFDSGYQKPAAVFSEASNKEKMRADLDRHFLKGSGAQGAPLAALAINELLDFLFKYGAKE